VVLFALFCAGLVLAVAGCGGDSSSSADTTTEEVFTDTTDTTETETTETDAMETETTDTEAMETGTTETDAMGTDTDSTTTDGSMTGGFAIANEECQELANASSELSQAFSGSGSANFEENAAFLDELADRAPEEIADDFQVLADAYERIGGVMDDVDTSSSGSMTPEQLSALMQLGQELNQVVSSRPRRTSRPG
jgi:hypothetical protein